MCLCLGHEFPTPLLQLTSPVIPWETILSILGAFQNPQEIPQEEPPSTHKALWAQKRDILGADAQAGGTLSALAMPTGWKPDQGL